MPIITPGGGGGSSSVAGQRGNYGATATGNAAPLTYVLLDWSYTHGVALLNVTVPSVPTIVTAGVYAVSVDLTLNAAVQAGKFMWGQLALNVSGAAGEDAFVTGSASMAGPDDGGAIAGVAMSVTWYCPAAAQLGLYVYHDGAVPLGFFSGIFIQRLS